MDIALTVGGSALNAFLAVLFDRMAKPEFLNMFRKQNFDHSILKKLERKLEILQPVLEDAENKHTKKKAVQKWLDQLQDVLYQADDFLDQINTEALRLEVETQYQTPATNQVSASTDPSKFNVEFLEEMMPKLELIVHELEYFEKQIHNLGLLAKEIEQKQPLRRPSTSLVQNDECGRDDERMQIIEDLLSDYGNCENLTVISILGLGGIGKTTLAKLVYNDDKVNKQFDTKAWVCISEEFDLMRITKSLLNELEISCPDPNETLNSLQQKLKKGLSDKKFLLVLDDIWNRNYHDWLALSAPFSGGKEGSKIILTTRDETIAKDLGNQHIHHLNPMSEEDCWTLFKKHALNNKDGTGNLKFESIGKEIVKKCGGLPLAVKAIAGLLRSKETIEEWEEILKSVEWEQSGNQSGILPSLRLSYTHLSSHLKRCFGYCAVFPKDYQFNKNEVILLWMANDLLGSPQGNKRLEDVGDDLFRELRLRSLFQHTSDGKFSMHDLVNDLAKSVSGDYFLKLESDWQEIGSLIVDRARHFSYVSGDYDAFKKFKPLEHAKFLKTFLPIDFNPHGHYRRKFSKKILSDIFPIFKSLRVLSLYGYGGITELPNYLSNLKQLRFLDLSYTRIKRLPSWICTFYNLQSLLLVYCEQLEEFPQDMEKLVNLRYLDMSGVPLTTMPLEIGKLKDIQFLSTFVVSPDNGSSIEKLGKLRNLHGKFTFSGLENVANASMAKVKDKKHIQKLTLEWKGDNNDSQVVRDVLQNLEPHTNIEHIEIKGYRGTRFPDWLEDTSFCHLRKLQISKCENCFCLPAIGQLPSLKHLSLSGLSNVHYIGIDHESRKSFLCLEELRIEDCPLLTEGIPKQVPSLKKLVISNCPGLMNSEGRLGVFDLDTEADFSSLVELEITHMPNLKEISSPELDLNKLLPSLEELEISSCLDINIMSFNRLPTALKTLKIYCSTRGSIQTCQVSVGSMEKPSLSLFPNLQSLNILVMQELPFSIPQNLTSLDSLQIRVCVNFMSFPVGGLNAPYLTLLSLDECRKLKSLPERMHTLLPSLQLLTISYCPEIERFPEEGLPPSLEALRINNCERLWSCHQEWGLHRLPSLKFLSLHGTDQPEALLPEDLLFPPTLTNLYMGQNNNAKTLALCGVLQRLTSLKSLRIRGCPELRSLPEMGLPHSLSRLSISNCPLLKQSLEWKKGEDWPKVAHIPIIEVDGELIP